MPRYRAALAWAGFFVGLITLTAYVGVDLVVDPYAEYSLFNNKKFYLDHFSGAYSMYAKLEQEGPFDLVLGTSMAGTINAAQLKAPTLNLCGSVYGRPEDMLDFFAGLDQRQWDHVRRVYCVADITHLDDLPGDYQGRNFHSAWERWVQTLRNFDSTKLFRAWNNVRLNLGWFGRPLYEMLPDGSLLHLDDKPFQPSSFLDQPGNRSMNYSQRQGDALRQLDQLLGAHHKPVVYFSGVLSDYYWCRMDPASLEPHYRCVLDALPAVVCMDMVPALSPRLDLFRDDVHPGNTLVDWEARLLLDPRAARPYVITKNNYKAHVAAVLAHIAQCRSR